VKDDPELRAEIAHLRSLAKLIFDRQVLASIDELIRELERRLQHRGNGAVGEDCAT
jgi:hypothetical protein